MSGRSGTPTSSLRHRGQRSCDDSDTGTGSKDAAQKPDQEETFVELRRKRFHELATVYGAVDKDGKYAGFWSDPFCRGDFACDVLAVQLPRLLLAILFFVSGLFVNSVSQAWLQKNLSGYYERLCDHSGMLASDDKSLWDVTFKLLPPAFVPSTRMADIYAIGGPVILLIRFVILPGPLSMRWTILRRWVTIWGIIWFARSITIIVTPLPNPDHSCTPVISAPDDLFLEAFYIATQQDLTCQDVMFSGHTVALTLSVLMVCRYMSSAPWSVYGLSRDWVSLSTLVGLLGRVVCLTGYYCIAGSRFHYTLDVLVGWLVTYTAFHAYHDKIDLMWLRMRHGGSDYFDKMLYWMDKDSKDRRVLMASKADSQEQWLAKH